MEMSLAIADTRLMYEAIVACPPVPSDFDAQRLCSYCGFIGPEWFSFVAAFSFLKSKLSMGSLDLENGNA